ncbi:unnamed protein product [Alopecurus aequalis]
MRASINRPPTPNQEEEEDEERKEVPLSEIINLKLVESGEKERLMELLRERLVECGWKDDMKALCSLSAWSSEGRAAAAHPILSHVFLALVVRLSYCSELACRKAEASILKGVTPQESNKSRNIGTKWI